MNKINGYVAYTIFTAKSNFNSFITSFKEDERGVSPVVATVLVILITILLAFLFRDLLATWFNELWVTITGSVDTLNTQMEQGVAG